jgi:hypothetical protein
VAAAEKSGGGAFAASGPGVVAAPAATQLPEMSTALTAVTHALPNLARFPMKPDHTGPILLEHFGVPFICMANSCALCAHKWSFTGRRR